ncbi:MAG: polysaccharide deacetylase family protein [Tannerellaceae bacterium]|jgi:peptidoglycan/xylan/chitin deacetylase (PgdA/CDA1 family)|nr:polysaccharide deacetylase family protein [Tannerellaceae bacterium]
MILLSFDIEEFDTPAEYGVTLSVEEQMRLSVEGVERLLAILKKHDVPATFFCTANFALRAPAILLEMKKRGYEIASHGYNHSSFSPEDLKKSKEVLERLTGLPVTGYRMARMMPVSDAEVERAGYRYNSSLNPAFVPGRYYNLNKPRRWFYTGKVLQIPASVTPCVRFPLFWLSFHHLPFPVYRFLALRTLKHDGYLNLYFHPWEFIELGKMKELKLPFLITNQSGRKMIKRLDAFIACFKQRGERFGTFSSFIEEIVEHKCV